MNEVRSAGISGSQTRSHAAILGEGRSDCIKRKMAGGFCWDLTKRGAGFSLRGQERSVIC